MPIHLAVAMRGVSACLTAAALGTLRPQARVPFGRHVELASRQARRSVLVIIVHDVFPPARGGAAPGPHPI